MGSKKEFEDVPIQKLKKINRTNKFLFLVLSFIFIFTSGIAYVYSYSFDPVLTIVNISFIFGILSVLIMNFFVYGKLVLLLRILAGDDEDDK